MHISVVIPIYLSDPLHVDFTNQTINSLKSTHQINAYIIDNFHLPQYTPQLNLWAKQPHLQIVPNPHGNTLAISWNIGIKSSFKKDSDFVLIINNDVICHPRCIDSLVDFSQTHPEFLVWSASEWADMRTLTKAKMSSSFSLHPHFSFFMVNKQTIDSVGYFDENLTGAYFEDNDYHTRILLSGYQAAATDSAKFYHYGSRTTAIDDNLKYYTKRYYQLNRQYLGKKWGVDFHGRAFDPPDSILKECFPTPFNDPHKSIKDW